MEKMKTPLVSVIMPVYNSEKFLDEAIESILKQTYRNLEIIIVDDGAKDHSLAIIEKYAQRDNRIKYWTKENEGVAKTLNDCIGKANGKYWIRMDADDISYPERIRVQVNYMENHPDVTICGSYAKENGKRLIKTVVDSESIKWYSFFWCPFIHPTVIMRAEMMKKQGLLYDNSQLAEDYELWLRSIDKVICGNIPKPLLYYRVHSSNVSSDNVAARKKADHILKKKYCEERGISYDIADHFFSDQLDEDEIQKRERIVKQILEYYSVRKFNILFLKCISKLYLDNYQSLEQINERYFRVYGWMRHSIFDKMVVRMYFLYRYTRLTIKRSQV